MNQASNEYATALFCLAEEENILDEVFASLSNIKKCFEDNKEYIDLLISPAISVEERVDIFSRTFSEENERTLAFMCLLIEKNRLAEFFEIYSEFDGLLKARKNVANAKIESAVELDDAQKARLVEAIEKKTNSKIFPEFAVDEKLIGGIKITVLGKVFDGSVKHHLDEVKEVIKDEN